MGVERVMRKRERGRAVRIEAMISDWTCVVYEFE
jgi:hypothetical protein